MVKCSKCDKSFETEQGLGLHNYRSHTAAGKNWGTAKNRTKDEFSTKSEQNTAKSILSPTSDTRSYIYQMLANQKEVKAKDIIQGMKSIGRSLSRSYISSLLTKDTNIIKIRRGTYRLKKNKHTVNFDSSVATLEKPQQEVSISKETLLLRVEHLEHHTSALKKALLILVNDVL